MTEKEALARAIQERDGCTWREAVREAHLTLAQRATLERLARGETVYAIVPLQYEAEKARTA